MIVVAISWAPVNVILSTLGDVIRALPTSRPSPARTLIAPGGKPISSTRRARYCADRGARSGDFRMMQQPAAIAGAIFQDMHGNGKFHGTSAATTPTGSWVVCS